MAEEVIRSAVEPFFTTKPPGKGSGLGLSQVYGTVQQSGGALRIESRVGNGTSIHLYLPKATPEATDLGAGRGELSPPEPGERILVVDDDPAVLEITVQMLRQAGYGVTEAESGRAALDALSRGELYDLMVIDIAMPGLNGIETVRRARERWPGLCALYICGYADAAGMGLLTGEDPLLKKPFKLDELTAAVRRALQSRPQDAGNKIVHLRRPSI